MAKVGLIGLGTMGANLALNLAEKGFPVAVHNRSPEKIAPFVASAGDLAERLTAAPLLADLVSALTPPRAIILMVQAGDAVDAQIDGLLPLLQPGDTIIDAGNADFNDTRRRERSLAKKGYNFIGMGVSGGSEGARHGPSIMVGGPVEAYAPIREMIEAIAAPYEGSPCAAHLGPDGAGHFVKTVHNGIEYADMQIIAEVYGIMRDGQSRMPAEIGAAFAAWNEGPLKSYLTEITAEVLTTADPETGQAMPDVIVDSAGQKGTGRWTVIEALRLGQSASTIEAAVGARGWSAAREMRADAEPLLGGTKTITGLPDTDLETAMLGARIIAYAQGFAVLEAASRDFGWDLDHARTAEIWRAGCIIRSALLDDISGAFRSGTRGEALILAPQFTSRLALGAKSLRAVVCAAVEAGHPVPAMSAALAYFDTMRKARGTANLIQAQRDFFGAHGFERLDKDGSGFHGPWVS
ncbi:MAG: NADP-dependent phosphogluconate dehydrogenase [Pseudomonadota bacterium]